MKSYISKSRIFILLMSILLPVAIFASLLGVRFDYKKNLSISENNGIVSHVYGDFPKSRVDSVNAALDALSELKDIYGFSNPYSELKLDKVSDSASGYIIDFDQYHEGVYVFPRELKVSISFDYKIKEITGNYLRDIVPTNRAIISNSDARLAAGNIGGEVFSCRLVVYTYETAPLYAYEVANSLNGGTNIYINAESGQIIRQIATTRAATITPHESVQADYYGNPLNQTIAVDNEGKYLLIDGYRNINVKYTTNKNNLIGTQYTSDDDIFDDKSLKEDIAITALKSVQNAFDFYKDASNIGVSFSGPNNTTNTSEFGSSPLSNQKQINLVIGINTYVDNAFCSSNFPDSNATTIFVGDLRQYALGADVLYHEYQHTMTNSVANLIYLNESGTIDEALSDIFAGLIEGYDMSDERFWTIGEDMPPRWSGQTNGTIRSAINPESYQSFSTAEYMYPFCYREGSHDEHIIDGYGNKCDNGGVHLNATIITHAIYKMYKDAESKSLAAFNNKNLGTMLFSTLQKLTPDATWVMFCDLLSRAPYELDISEADKEALVLTIKQGFIDTYLYNRQIDEVAIRFGESDYFEGTLPSTIVVPAGESFTAPLTADLTHKMGDSDRTILAWTETPHDIKSTTPYIAGSEFVAPNYSITLYPIFVKIARWNNFSFTNWEGEGTLASPYLIKTADDLAALAYYTNSGTSPQIGQSQVVQDRHFKLTNDIDLLGIEWTPINLFKSLAKTIHLDGNGFAIKRLFITNDGFDYQGLFGIASGEIKNLTIQNGTILTDAKGAGGIAGLLENNATLSNCVNNADIAVDGAAGGLAGIAISGYSDTTIIKNSLNSGRVNATFSGGMIGKIIRDELHPTREDKDAVATIANCINSDTITGKYAGGMVAVGTNILFINCINAATICSSKTSGSVGGIIGFLNLEETDYKLSSGFLGCKNAGAISKGGPAVNAGGIAGNIYLVYGYALRFQNTIYPALSGLSAVGGNFAPSFQAGSWSSGDSIYSGDFDFASKDYYLDASRWGAANGVSNLEFITNWQHSEGELPVPKTTAPTFWNTGKASAFSGGKGTVFEPYQINSAGELALLLYNVNNQIKDTDGTLYSKKHYKQTADIDMKDKFWTGIGYIENSGKVVSFEGGFDGDGYAISNLLSLENSANGKTTHAALFTAVGGDTKTIIQNINLVDFVSEGNLGAAGIAYAMTKNASLRGCKVSGYATSELGVAGGIAATALSSATNIEIVACINNAFVSARTAAGILGTSKISKTSTMVIKNCVNDGEISNYYMGGYRSNTIAAAIVGSVSGRAQIISSINRGRIDNFGTGYASGICGFLEEDLSSLDIEGCKQIGDIFASSTQNASSILSANYGKYGNISIKKTHYKATDNDKPEVAKSLIDNLATDDCVEIENYKTDAAFDFDTLDYYKNADYFTDTAAFQLYMMLNGTEGFVFIAFVDFDGNLLEIVSVAKGEGATVPYDAPTKESDVQFEQTLLGWATFEGQPQLADQLTANVDTVFYQTYQTVTKEYTVRFLEKDGTIIATKTYKYGTIIDLAAPTKKGYTFKGWYKNDSFTEEVTSVTIEGTTTIYAKWQKDSTSCLSIAPDNSMFIFFTLTLLVTASLSALIYHLTKKRKPTNSKA